MLFWARVSDTKSTQKYIKMVLTLNMGESGIFPKKRNGLYKHHTIRQRLIC